MSTTFQLDTGTSRANPTPAPMKRLTRQVWREASVVPAVTAPMA